MLWDLFCRVIDNWGDLGVCWRLAADLHARGHPVRLWVDDPAPLAWMAPQVPPGIEVRVWEASMHWPAPGDVVVEAFGCALPPSFVAGMAAQARPPVWINLEYLSAEPYAQRSHGLRSPQQGVAQGLSKFFFYPGWVEGTGGLLREPDLACRQAAFDASAWLAGLGIATRPKELRVSLFCYHNPALPSLLAALRAQPHPSLLLVTAGLATEQVRALPDAARDGEGGAALRVAFLPSLSQAEFDHLLWACDLNLVRGEDSFVRAHWAQRPFLWQIYPQDDGAHAAKLEAWHTLMDREVGLPKALPALSRAWNGMAADPAAPLPWPVDWSDWQQRSRAWGERLRRQADLASRLLAFVDSHRTARER